MGQLNGLKILLCITLLSATSRAENFALPPIPTTLSFSSSSQENFDVANFVMTVDQRIKKVNEVYHRYHPKKEFQGAVLIARGSTVLFDVGYGNFTKDVPYDGDTPILLGSTTKQFTAALVLKEVEKGKMSLEASIRRYFPNKPCVPNTTCIPNTPPNWENVTVAMLLTQTSGFLLDYIKNKGVVGTNSQDKILSYIIRNVKSLPAIRNSKTPFRYDNANYFLLGKAVENVNGGRPLAELVAEEITDPLHMKNSAMIDPNSKGIHGKLYAPDLLPAANNPASYFAVGNMYSSTNDLFKWIWGLVNKQVVHDPVMLSKMLSAQPKTDHYWKGFHTDNGQTNKYGYGLHVSIQGGRLVDWHTGHLTGHTTLVKHYRCNEETSENGCEDQENQMTIIVLTNTDEYPVFKLADEAMDVVFKLVPETNDRMQTASTQSTQSTASRGLSL
jgi:CubicO group peptidase (beta-lactamase class C family)